MVISEIIITIITVITVIKIITENIYDFFNS